MIIEVTGGTSVAAQTSSLFVHVFRREWNVWKEGAYFPERPRSPQGADNILKGDRKVGGQNRFKNGGSGQHRSLHRELMGRVGV